MLARWRQQERERFLGKMKATGIRTAQRLTVVASYILTPPRAHRNDADLLGTCVARTRVGAFAETSFACPVHVHGAELFI